MDVPARREKLALQLARRLMQVGSSRSNMGLVRMWVPARQEEPAVRDIGMPGPCVPRGIRASIRLGCFVCLSPHL
jgi:hypothetical protein